MEIPKTHIIETQRCRLRITSREDIPQGFKKRGQWIEENLFSITKEQWERQ